MSESDDLWSRLARVDPARNSLVPVESHPAPELMERIMTTPVLPDPTVTGQPTAKPSRLPRMVAAAAAVLVLAGGTVVALNQGGSSSPGSSRPGKRPTSVTLTLPGGGGLSSNSCLRFDTKILAGMSPAFAGTVTDVSGGQATLNVDRWYAGGTADQVVLTVPSGVTSVAIDGGIDLEKGKRYLITAAQGTVNGCGYSGPATPDFEKSFDEAFPTK
jgi:hypothetical protein